MTLHFKMRREDALEFNRQFYSDSPTYKRTRAKVRLMLPIIMSVLWVMTTLRSGFEWTPTIIFLGFALAWFFIYPSRYDRNVEKYCEKTIDEGSYRKNYGDYQLILSESGLHSIGPSGESKYHWSSVDRTLITDDYLFIFLNGPLGYPILISDVDRESALAAREYVTSHIENHGEQEAAGQSATVE